MSRTIVVDSNVVISALLTGGEHLIRCLRNSGNTFVSTNYLVIELFKHSPKIREKSNFSIDELLELLSVILGRVRLIDDGLIGAGSWIEAVRLCRGVDMDDLAFVALSLDLDAMLWTQDKRLKDHLIKNGFNNFFEQ